MTKLEHDLINEKFKGVYARLDANSENINNTLMRIEYYNESTLKRIENETTKLIKRVDILEAYKWKIMGASIAISAIFAALISVAGLLKISESSDGDKTKIEITTRGETINQSKK